jgi:hypothetical protein
MRLFSSWLFARSINADRLTQPIALGSPNPFFPKLVFGPQFDPFVVGFVQGSQHIFIGGDAL